MVTRIDIHYRLQSIAADLGTFWVTVPPIVLVNSLPYPVPPDYPRHLVENPGRWLVADRSGSSEKPLRSYDPMAEAEPLLTAATVVNTQDDDEVVRFVNHWGLLLENATGSFPCVQLDIVKWTLETVRKLARWLSAMKRNKRRLPDTPTKEDVLLDVSHWSLSRIEKRTKLQLVERLWERDAEGLSLGNDAESRARAAKLVPEIPSRYWRRLYWEAFARNLNSNLKAVWPSLGIDEKTRRPVQGLQVRLPADVLFLFLWQQTLEEDQIGRLCPGCTGVFFVARTNERRLYCSTRCKSRINVRRYRASNPNARKSSQKRDRGR